MPRFTSIPEVPQGGLLDWQSILFSGIKENLELLMGMRGESDLASRAIIRGDISVSAPAELTLRDISARGTGFTVSSVDVAGLDDYKLLILDTASLRNDVYNMHYTLRTLISQMKGS